MAIIDSCNFDDFPKIRILGLGPRITEEKCRAPIPGTGIDIDNTKNTIHLSLNLNLNMEACLGNT